MRSFPLAALFVVCVSACDKHASEHVSSGAATFTCHDVSHGDSLYAINASAPLVTSSTPFRAYVFDAANVAEFSSGRSFACLNEGCGSLGTVFSSPDVLVPVRGAYSVVVVCAAFPCRVDWNVAFGLPVFVQKTAIHRQLDQANGCAATSASISTSYSDWTLAYVCYAAQAGHVWAKANEAYAMVQSTTNDKFRVMILDTANYLKYTNADSSWSCVAGTDASCGAILKGGDTFNGAFVIPQTQPYVVVVQCQNAPGYTCTFRLNFQISFVLDVAASGDELTTSKACSFLSASTRTTLNAPLLVFTCDVMAGWTFGPKYTNAPLIVSTKNDASFMVYLYTSVSNTKAFMNEGNALNCTSTSDNSCISAFSTWDYYYEVPFVLPYQGTYLLGIALDRPP
ncbi:Aste57867_3679 [Aphanomyces stellatus]|uniref:Aste57867_3679 protein n=1 Tax=Aphanomyces stellatus TaxID=120398 RepID=A0A485KE15_9STRA|nr:hypothetical protein As57867_003668 [Aphanomyces stellatus]VFT80834.1 Aste57867_3679 [Aphanomyces stellatus]